MKAKFIFKVYKLFRIKNGKLYPLYVEAKREILIGVWLTAGVGEKVDPTHVKANGCGGKLSLRPGFHSTLIPVANWIGKRDPASGELLQRKDTVWCECEVCGDQLIVTDPNGSRELLDGWYYYRTNSKQKYPWIISKYLRVVRIVPYSEVCAICLANGVEPQRLEVA